MLVGRPKVPVVVFDEDAAMTPSSTLIDLLKGALAALLALACMCVDVIHIE